MARYEDFSVTKLRVDQVMMGDGNVEEVTDGKTMTAEDNGKTLILADAASGDITMPPVTLTGFEFTVLCGFTITSDSEVTSAEGDNISGPLIVNGAAIPAAAEDQINFIGSAAVLGDWAKFKSTGAAWTVTGIGGAAGSITATDPA